MTAVCFEVKVIGRVDFPLTELASAPCQADEGAPAAWLVFEPEMQEGLSGLRAGDEIIVITWLDRARRDVLSVHPRGDTSRALEGASGTRSPPPPLSHWPTAWRLPPSTVDECGCTISKCWMGHQSSTSSRYSADTSANVYELTTSVMGQKQTSRRSASCPLFP